jgi:uncharacterized membrane protein
MGSSPIPRWGAVLGFALGGFFDGILLHQILQWHHLLSLVPGMDDLRLQVLWDGYFHALMYGLAALALVGLWRAHRRGAQAAGSALAAALLMGFGLWHVVDSVLSHWLLGIHRIRVDSPNPLFWDLVWFFGFGVAPLLLAGWLLRGNGGGGRMAGRLALVALTLGTLGAAAWSLRPPADTPFTTVVFQPGLAPAQVAQALARQDARLVWADPAMGVVVVEAPQGRALRLYAEGAWLVGGAGLPAGCLGWSRV